jgi:ATPase subunit of ABC transporter with duplicated ATPase domains
MDRVATHILELSPVTRRLKTYYGRYADYLAQREAEYTQALDAYIGQVSAISSLKRSVKMQTHNPKAAPPPPDGDKLLYNARRANAQDTRRRTIRDARQRLATLEDTLPENPAHRWTIRFEFDPLPLTSAEPLRFTGLTKRYGGRVLFENLSGVLRRGERAVLVAPNGTGKTTLLRLLAGHITPDAGHIALSSSAKTGYLDQEGETQDGTQPVLAAYRAAALTPAADRDLLAELHRSGLFTDASLPQKRIADLSQGQRRKLGLACLLAARASVLLLDEPTNHLDPLSLEALEAALRHFPGALLAVSHDRRFIDRVATHLWELRDGQLYVQAVAP